MFMVRYNKTSDVIENQVFKAYQKGFSSVKLAKNFNLTPTTILAIVKRKGGKTRTTKETSKKYSFNENFFEKIDTEQKAYWLGFIVADGCICRNDIIIELKDDDEIHIKKFIKDIDGNNKTQSVSYKQFNSHHTRLSIRSKKMYNDLINLGITTNKSLTASKPHNIPTELEKHFWRGIIDGDGCVYTTTYKEKHREYQYPSFSLTGSEKIIEGFIKFIKMNLHIELKKEREKNVWRVRKTGRVVPSKICALLYKDSMISLNRKKNAYEIFDITRYPQQNRTS